jgi:hypothetical protein
MSKSITLDELWRNSLQKISKKLDVLESKFASHPPTNKAFGLENVPVTIFYGLVAQKVNDLKEQITGEVQLIKEFINSAHEDAVIEEQKKLFYSRMNEELQSGFLSIDKYITDYAFRVDERLFESNDELNPKLIEINDTILSICSITE